MNRDMMASLVGKVIKVDRGGPESRVGMLMGVGEDFFTILTEKDGVTFYRTHHIKSITENSKNGMVLDLEIPENFTFIKAPTFKATLDLMKYQWVKINRGGKETIEGVLDDINDDYVTMVLGEEVIRLSMFHIRNISYGAVIEKPKKEEAKSENSEVKSETTEKQE